MLLEDLPTELFLQIFGFLSLRDIVTGFFGLNSYIDSIIRSIRDASHAVKYNDIDALNLLHLFPSHIGRLMIINVEMANLTPLINLRSLGLKYGTKKQLDTIRPQNFPMLETLHIRGIMNYDKL
jgi:hypothetical protein